MEGPLGGLRGGLARNAAVDQAVEDRAGAEAHGPVHAARRLARGVEPRDRLRRRDIHHAAGRVGDEPAHAVVDLRAHLGGVPGAGGERNLLVVDVAAEFRILLRLHVVIELRDGGLQRIGRDLEVGGEVEKTDYFEADAMMRFVARGTPINRID